MRISFKRVCTSEEYLGIPYKKINNENIFIEYYVQTFLPSIVHFKQGIYYHL